MARKTIAVTRLRELVNNGLATKDSSLAMRAPGKDREATAEEAFRLGIASVLEIILHKTGNYHGFNYQEGVVDFTQDPPAIPGDQTRRVYH